ncbi:tachylectin-related carbohydrate-binding protein [Streptomyces sp. NPDC000229]|uniref:tachylectin-related carbohydrate-binding protein n=1 Tax=Streptomyces sp. NPDC000229 TaxID=3154247 RepID=UPI003320E876
MTTNGTNGTRRWTATAVAAAAALPLLVALPGTASAADAASCTTNGPTYAVSSTGSLMQYTMKAPINGSGGYNAPTTIGSGWHNFGLVLAGPDGAFYGFKSDGVYYGHRTDAGVWDVSPNRVSTSFGFLATAANRGQAAVDRDGWLWVVDEAGALRTYKYNSAANSWDVGRSKAHDDGWDRYNLIIAADAGVLYGRSATDGKLYRSRYDIASQRWIERHVLVSPSDWNQFESISSNGGDTLLATKSSTGEAFYYRFDENTRSWPVTTVKVGTGGWAAFRDVAAAPDNCRILKNHTPVTTALPKETGTRTAVIQAGGGKLHFAYTNNIGRLTLGTTDPADINNATWTVVPENEAFAGEPSLSTHSDGRVSVAVHNTTGSIWQRFQAATNSTDWAGWHDQAGAMVHHPVTGKAPSGTLVEFAADASGKPWYRLVAKDGLNFKGWMPLAGSGFTGPFATGTVRDGVQLVGKKADGTLATARFKEDGSLSAWTALGTQTVTGTPAVIVNPGYTVSVFATDAVTKSVVTAAQAAEGGAFGTWSALQGLTAKGSPSVLIAPNGKTEIVVRGEDDVIHNTGETVAGSLTWRTWKPAAQYEGAMPEVTATDPTAFTFTGPNGPVWGFVFRNSDDQTRVYTAGSTTIGN